jgi:plasmid stabilization system protein ParE
MRQEDLQHYNVIRTDYADERMQDKLEYIKREFKSIQAYKHLQEEISKTEVALSNNAKHNRPHYDNNGEEYRYAFVDVGEGYYLLYQVDEDTVYILDCFHKRELREMV